MACGYYIHLEGAELHNATKLFTTANLNMLTFRENASQQHNATCILTFPAAVQGILDSLEFYGDNERWAAQTELCIHKSKKFKLHKGLNNSTTGSEIVYRLEQKRYFWRPKHRQNNKVIMDLREMRCVTVEWNKQAQGMIEWRDFVNTEYIFQFKKVRKL